MSDSILWRKVDPSKGEALYCHAPSSFKASMQRAFGDFPCRLSAENLETLEGMDAVCGDKKTIYSDIATIIRKHGAIDIWNES